MSCLELVEGKFKRHFMSAKLLIFVFSTVDKTLTTILVTVEM